MHHKLAITLFPLAVFSAYFGPYVFAGVMFIFFLVTSFKLLKKMLFYMLVLGVISLIPLLNIVVWVVMVVFFFMRIRFVIQHWRPFLSGVGIYGGSALIATRGSYIAEFRAFALDIGNPIPNTYWIEAALVSLLAVLALHVVLRWLYAHGYNSHTALGIMGSVPLIIISFILPFLKLHIGGDVIAHYHGAGEPVVYTGEPVVTPHGGADLQDPQQAHVKSYVRTAPDGDPTNNLSYDGPDAKPINSDSLVHVDEYLRTTPDSNSANNLSYNESDAKTVNSDPLVHVSEYVRTAPDGDPTNNLSYDGPDAKPVNPDALVYVSEHMRTAPDGIAENNLSYADPRIDSFSGIVPPVQASDRVVIDSDLMGKLLQGRNESGISDQNETGERFYSKEGAALSASTLAPIVRKKMTEVDKHRAVGQNAVDRLIKQHNRTDNLQS